MLRDFSLNEKIRLGTLQQGAAQALHFTESAHVNRSTFLGTSPVSCTLTRSACGKYVTKIQDCSYRALDAQRLYEHQAKSADHDRDGPDRRARKGRASVFRTCLCRCIRICRVQL